MSGVISDNTVRSSGAVAPLSSATLDAGNPAADTNPTDGIGTKWINTTSGVIFVCSDATSNDNTWVGQTDFGPRIGGKAVFMMGQYTASGNTQSVDVFTIDTLGNATDLGDMPSPALYAVAGSDNGTLGRAVAFGGSDGSYKNTISYITIDTLGNGASFGTFDTGVYSPGACSNGPNDRAVKCGGVSGPWVYQNSMQYVTVSTTGDASDQADLSFANFGMSGTSNGTNDRGLLAMGSGKIAIDYFTINTQANAVDFGDVTNAAYCGAFSNGTNERACFAGGSTTGTGGNSISYVTMTSTGNGTSFGTLSILTDWTTATSSGSVGDRGLISLGQDYTGGFQGRVKTVEYVTISSPSNAADFGDCTDLRASCAAGNNAMT